MSGGSKGKASRQLVPLNWEDAGRALRRRMGVRVYKVAQCL